MAKCSSPRRIGGRKRSFCSSVPNWAMVGPTVLSVTLVDDGPPLGGHQRAEVVPQLAPQGLLRIGQVDVHVASSAIEAPSRSSEAVAPPRVSSSSLAQRK